MHHSLGFDVCGARLQETGFRSPCPGSSGRDARQSGGHPVLFTWRRLTSLAVLLVVLVVAWALPPSARAHGTGSRWLDGGEPTLAVYFHYSTGEPMSWNKVKVYGPGDEKTEFVASRTDRNGKFAFMPDRPGHWRVEASDDEGHKAVAETEYQPAGRTSASDHVSSKAGPENGGPGPFWMRVVLGVSLVLNLFVGASFLKRKS